MVALSPSEKLVEVEVGLLQCGDLTQWPQEKLERS